MALKDISGKPEGDKDNIKGLSDGKQEKIRFIDRAPVAGDSGSMYVQYASGGTTLKLFIRHPLSGSWLSATLS